MQSKIKILILIFILFTQVDGMVKINSLNGTVVDKETRQPLIGVNIYLQNKNIGTTTNDKGYYNFENLEAANYTVIFSYVGYTKLTKTDIVIRSGRETELNIFMEAESFELENVVVTGGYYSGLKEKPVSTISYSNEEVRRAPGAGGDIGRILTSLPSIAKTNDQRNSLIVRGGSSLENVSFIDNIEIPNINHFPVQGNSGGAISLIDVDFLSDVTFSAGGFSAIYGDKLSSILELKYREGNYQKFYPQLNLSMKGVGISAEGPIIKDKMSFLFSANRSYLDMLLEASQADGALPRYYDIQGKISWQINENNKLSLINILGDDLTELSYDKSVESGENSYGLTKSVNNTMGINWQNIWEKNGYSNSSISHNFQKYKYDLKKTSDMQPDFYNESIENQFNFRNINYYKMSDDIKIEFGAEAKYVINDFLLKFGESKNENGEVKAAYDINRKLNLFTTSGYFTLNYNLSEKLSLIPGLRFDYYDVNKKSLLSPRLTLSYQLSNISAISISSGIYYQNIPAIILVQNDEYKNLDVPKAYHFIAGYSLMLSEDTKLSFEIYNKEYRKFPMDTSDPEKFLLDKPVADHVSRYDGTLNSDGEAYARGVELTIQKKMAKNIYGLFSLSYSKTKYKDLNGIWRDRIYDNQFMFALEGGYKPGESWDLSLKWLYAGGAPFTPYDEVKSKTERRGVLDLNKYNGERFQDYHSLTIRLDKRFNFTNSNLVVYLDVWNIYNRTNIAGYEWSESRNEKREIKQWSILPVLGIEYEF
ncbi:MAG: TonB-dependent receptor [Ignavibacteria bacterium]|nr:TonB-dependent receptor [Ignavibacteria bacterium]